MTLTINDIPMPEDDEDDHPLSEFITNIPLPPVPPPPPPPTPIANSSHSEPAVAAFRTGSIRSIFMKDFLAFRSGVTFTPGPGLNVVLGQNGSGKSTIVNAIAVGLGAGVEVLKRQERLADLVNNESSSGEALVVIRLDRGGGENDGGDPGCCCYEIECIISKRGSVGEEARYKIDGRPSGREQVREFARRLRIQIQNPCVFLPQDVVAGFPALRPQELFDATLRALGDVAALEMNEELLRTSRECRKLEESLEIKQATLAELERKYGEYKPVVDDLKEREKVQQTIARLLMYAEYLKVKELQRKLRSSKDEKLKLEEGEKKAKGDLQAAEASLVEYNAKHRELKGNVDALKLAVSAESDHMDNPAELQELEEKVKDISSKIDIFQKSQGERAELMQQYRVEAGTIECRMQRSSAEALKTKLAAAVDRRNADHLAHSAEQARMEQLRDELSSLSARKKSLKEKISQGSTDMEKRLKLLRQVNRDAMEGTEWLLNNRSLFKGKVHVPIMCLLKLRTPTDAIYLEKLIGGQDLEAFVCEIADDANLLMKCLRGEQKLKRINVVHSSPHDASDGEFDEKWSSKPKGFRSFVSKMFDCPSAIKNHLCRSKNLHKIPVFDRDCDEVAARDMFPKYFVGKRLFTVRRCRYSQAKMANVEDCYHDKCPHFVRYGGEDASDDRSDSDDGRVHKEELADVRRSMTKSKNVLNEATANVKRKEEALSESRQEVDLATAEMKEQQVMSDKLRSLKLQLTALSKMTSGKEDLAEMMEQRSCLTRRMSGLLKALEAKSWTVVGATTKLELLKIEMTKLEIRHSKDKEAKDIAWTELKEQVAQLKRASQKLFRDAKQFTVARDKLAWEGDSRSRLVIPSHIQDNVKQDCDNFSNLNCVKVKAESLRRGLAALPVYTTEEVNAAKNLEEKLDRANREVRKIKSSLRDEQQRTETRRKNLIDRVDKSINEVDERFSRMLNKLGYSGQVSLTNIGSGDDDYLQSAGIEVRVKFRGADTLQKLMPGVQSGGEKSLTTAIFMLALQQMTEVPFRCMDEINQGMDEANERAVWDFLLHTTTNHQGQYFYLAQKIPRGLTFNLDTTVVNCFSGSCVTSRPLPGGLHGRRHGTMTFNIAEMLQKIRTPRHP